MASPRHVHAGMQTQQATLISVQELHAQRCGSATEQQLHAQRYKQYLCGGQRSPHTSRQHQCCLPPHRHPPAPLRLQMVQLASCCSVVKLISQEPQAHPQLWAVMCMNNTTHCHQREPHAHSVHATADHQKVWIGSQLTCQLLLLARLLGLLLVSVGLRCSLFQQSLEGSLCSGAEMFAKCPSAKSQLHCQPGVIAHKV